VKRAALVGVAFDILWGGVEKIIFTFASIR
jgi:hypothetical protein